MGQSNTNNVYKYVNNHLKKQYVLVECLNK